MFVSRHDFVTKQQTTSTPADPTTLRQNQNVSTPSNDTTSRESKSIVFVPTNHQSNSIDNTYKNHPTIKMSTKKKSKSKDTGVVKVETITMDEQHKEIITFLHHYAMHMREVERDPLQQALFGGIGAVLGVVGLSLILGSRFGLWGGAIGAIVGTFTGYAFTSKYDEKVEQLSSLNDAGKKLLVDNICKILKDKGKLESTIVLKNKGKMAEVFFEVTKESVTRAQLWNACNEVLKTVGPPKQGKQD
eukprot:scaffold21883_cov199-Amphora_coffeaeformis.AAC.4